MNTRFKSNTGTALASVINQLDGNIKGLEIGVWYGHNMGFLLDNCPNIVHLYGIDPYEPYQDWNRYIDQSMVDAAKHSAIDVLGNFPTERCTLLQTTSEKFEDEVDKSGKLLDFVFIDGDHSFEACYRDLHLWYKHVRPGGIFAGHDFTLPGVNAALARFRKEKGVDSFSNFKVVPNDVWYWIKD